MGRRTMPPTDEPMGNRTIVKIGSLLLIVLLCLAALGAGCSGKKEVKAPEKVVNIKVAVVERLPVRPYLEALGTLEPNDEVKVSSEVDGTLKAIRVDEGNPVTKGTILAEVNDTDYRLAVDNAQAALKQAEASLANIKIEYQRKEALFKEELVTKQQFDDVSTRLTIAGQDLDRVQANLSLVREKLTKTIIRSSQVGIVNEKMVTAGDFVRAGMPILTIIQIDPLKLSFTVAEKDIGAMKEGQDVIFSVDPFPGKAFTGRLSIIYPNLEERTRTLKVKAVIPNPSLQLKPGLFARVKVYTGSSREAVVIPITAILYEGTKIKVFLLEGERVKARPIQVGVKYGEMIEVIEGLKGGEQLVVVGQNNLAEGIKVHVVQ